MNSLALDLHQQTMEALFASAPSTTRVAATQPLGDEGQKKVSIKFKLNETKGVCMIYEPPVPPWSPTVSSQGDV